MEETAEHLELFIKGAIIGHLVGDALGYPYENMNNLDRFRIEMIPGKHGEREGSWAAPGAFTLATIASIGEFDGVDLDDIMDKFNDVYLGGYLTPDDECKDIGKFTSTAISNYTNGNPVDRCGIDKEELDNECLTRMLPIGLYYASETIDEQIDKAHSVCSLTHANIISQVVCAIYCLIIRNMLTRTKEKVIDLLHDYYRVKEMQKYQKCLENLVAMRNNRLEGTKNLTDSLWTAWSIHADNQTDFRCCVTDAVKLGKDTNGTACLAGSFSGLSNGLNDIPLKWLNTLKLTSEAIDVTQNFVDQVIAKVLAKT